MDTIRYSTMKISYNGKMFTPLSYRHLLFKHSFMQNHSKYYECFFFSRNGHSLGVAFDTVQYGPGLAYFPAASLSYGESCEMNFGGAPFKYPFCCAQSININLHYMWDIGFWQIISELWY